MSNLFNLSLEYVRILDEIEENLGEITDDIQDRLAINKDEVEEKLENYRKVVATLDGEIATLEEERERLAAKVVTKTKIIDRLKRNMADAVELYGDVNPKSKTANKSFVTPFSKFTFVHTNPVVVDSDLDLTPDNRELLPYLNGIFTAKVKGEEIIKVINKLTTAGLKDLFVGLYGIDKKAIKPVLETRKPYIDPDTGEQGVDEVTGELVWMEPFNGDIRIDTEAGYLKTT